MVQLLFVLSCFCLSIWGVICWSFKYCIVQMFFYCLASFVRQGAMLSKVSMILLVVAVRQVKSLFYNLLEMANRAGVDR